MDPQNAKLVSCSAQALADLHANQGAQAQPAIQNADGDRQSWFLRSYRSR